MALETENIRIGWRRRLDQSAPMHALALEAALAAAAPAARVEFIPSTEGAMTPKDDALGLLALAAEVEHALLVQYLYAAASVLSDDTIDDNPHIKIVRIAVQEMMHLIGVQNLLIALGGPAAIHVGRDKLRSASDENPLPFGLEAATRASLSKYALVEMPNEVDGH